MEDNKVLAQAPVAEDLSNRIIYNFIDTFLVKPLEPIKVKKEFNKLPEKQTVKDKNGIEAVDIEDGDIQVEVKEVDSDYRRGIVLKVPYSYSAGLAKGDSYFPEIKVGDVILYKDGDGKWFDLLKDSQMIKQYSIVALVNK